METKTFKIDGDKRSFEIKNTDLKTRDGEYTQQSALYCDGRLVRKHITTYRYFNIAVGYKNNMIALLDKVLTEACEAEYIDYKKLTKTKRLNSDRKIALNAKVYQNHYAFKLYKIILNEH